MGEHTHVSIQIELPKNRDQQPISLFFSRYGRRVRTDAHCFACGLTFMSSDMQMTSAVDNAGPTDVQYVEVMCKRCKQLYRIYVLWYA